VVEYERFVQISHPPFAVGMSHLVVIRVRRYAIDRGDLPPPHELPLELLQRADREMQDIDWIPAGKRRQSRDGDLVVAAADFVFGRAAVGCLEVWVERVNSGRRLLPADGHALCENSCARTRNEVAPHAAHAPETIRNGTEHVLQRGATRPPELVR